ncbi:glutamate-1-semialdehyde 2,1-aminomutase [Clostridium cylindrosporum]|uniref:Glutamate-1-semialdehyde 2,1-aminomutase n=1 Tax=Clostridium cylindrosporum DSM 605 TaxID=1121307 RepID=A0A0J8D7H0_CLOCY|nr:glutamate-1-semialdehyde 2,1-aminomutase [Clostridium cylindrosporum]KMT21842.1 glutamate-1-semialdehyde 2,1-aminomutase 2 [Clostridium cylindrosporum DSM 605]
MTISENLNIEAQKYIPGGVNSPVRAFRSVGSTPRFMKSADGAYLIDEDGNKYLDFIGSWGPMILGHNHPDVREAVIDAAASGLSFGAATKIEVEMAKLICEVVPSVELVRMVNSGTEAVMSALRVARGHTGRDKIIKFEGCYHGHSDSMLVKAGSGALTTGVPDSAGVPEGCAKDTLTAIYNDINSVERLFEENKGEIAAIIIEPVVANMGVVLPKDNFLQKLRDICTENGALLIFDEVITGFRLGIDGAQGYFNVKPDLTIFGKIIGGGMPVGAYGGKREIMENVAPLGKVYQAGTLSGNPIAMAAGITQLRTLRDNPKIYEHIRSLGNRLATGIEDIIKKHNLKCSVNNLESLCCFFFSPEKIEDYNGAKTSDTAAYAKYFNFMLNKGIYLAPAQFEAMFISNAHTEKDIDFTLECIEEYFTKGDM